MNKKLGRLPKKEHPKTLKLSKYFSSSLPVPPSSLPIQAKIPDNAWGMMGNDIYGDCTCACIGHMEMNFTSDAGSIIAASTHDVLQVYTDVTGFQVGPPVVNDDGAVITDVLAYWASVGLPLKHKKKWKGSQGFVHHVRRKILAWAEIDQTNLTEVQQGVYLFGGVNIGVNLPNSAMDQFDNGQVWKVVKPDGGIDGGHCVPILGYNQTDAACITWGQTQEMTWGWFQKYCDEAYVVITEDWINQSTQKTINGFDLEQLQADISAMKA